MGKYERNTRISEIRSLAVYKEFRNQKKPHLIWALLVKSNISSEQSNGNADSTCNTNDRYNPVIVIY